MSGRKHIWKVLRKFHGVFFCMWVVWDPKLQVGTLTQVSSLAFWHGMRCHLLLSWKKWSSVRLLDEKNFPRVSQLQNKVKKKTL